MSVANPSTPKEDEDEDDSQVARRRSPPLAQAVPLVLLPFRLSLLIEHRFRSLEGWNCDCTRQRGSPSLSAKKRCLRLDSGLAP